MNPRLFLEAVLGLALTWGIHSFLAPAPDYPWGLYPGEDGSYTLTLEGQTYHAGLSPREYAEAIKEHCNRHGYWFTDLNPEQECNAFYTILATYNEQGRRK